MQSKILDGWCAMQILRRQQYIQHVRKDGGSRIFEENQMHGKDRRLYTIWWRLGTSCLEYQIRTHGIAKRPDLQDKNEKWTFFQTIKLIKSQWEFKVKFGVDWKNFKV